MEILSEGHASLALPWARLARCRSSIRRQGASGLMFAPLLSFVLSSLLRDSDKNSSSGAAIERGNRKHRKHTRQVHHELHWQAMATSCRHRVYISRTCRRRRSAYSAEPTEQHHHPHRIISTPINKSINAKASIVSNTFSPIQPSSSNV